MDQRPISTSLNVLKEENKEKSETKTDPFHIETQDGMFMYRHVLVADDSCLFNTIGLALKNSLSMSHELR